MNLSRRQFIKIAAGGAGAAAVGSGIATQWWGLDGHRPFDPGTEGRKVVPTFCELCFWKCGVLAHVRDGVVTKLKGNPKHPLSKGRLCPRGLGGAALLYDPDRLRQPLLRVKARGQDVFEAVTWETALDHVAGKLLEIRAKYGPEAMALFTHGYGGSWFKHLFDAYGSPNVAAPSYAQCRGPREVAYQLTFGQGCGSPENIDIAHARCLTLIGSHLGENMHNTQVQELADALDAGAQLVVVDPRFSTAAGKARYWLPIKPGTDLALLLAWMHVIIAEGRYDHDYVARHASGFAQLKAHVADKTPAWAWARTGLKPELIVETARFIAGFRPASLIHPGRRVTWYGDDTQRLRAMAILTALLGAWGRRGGHVLPSKMHLPAFPYTTNPYQPKDPADRPPARYPLAEETLASGLCDATTPGVMPYQIRGWMVYGTNLIQALPDPRKTAEAIQALDFMVAIDVLPAEICGWADVVLPECTYLERCDDLWAAEYAQPFIALRQPVVPPRYDSKPGWWIAKQLGQRLGLADYFPWKDSEEYAHYRIEKAGYTCDQFRADGVLLGTPAPTCEEEGLALSFDTSDGKIQLYSKELAAQGHDPLPNYTPPVEPPAGMLRMLFGRAPMHSFGRTTNNRFLSEVYDQNELWIHPSALAAQAGLAAAASGDYVVLVNQDLVRSEPIRLRVTERIRGDCVYLVHGYGHTARGLRFAHRRGASDSELVTRYAVDPIMGGTGMNVNFVRLEPAALDAEQRKRLAAGVEAS